MGFLDGVFGGARKAAQAAAVQAKLDAQPNRGGARGQDMPQNQSAHPGTMVTKADGTPMNPLDGFANLFKPQLGEDKKPIVAQQVDWNSPYLPTVKAEDLAAAAKGLDFTKGLDPELATKALAGDLPSLMSLLNHVGQQAFIANTQVANTMVEQGARASATRVNGALDSQVRNIAIKEQNPTNEALLHENVKPVFDGLKMMIASNNPKMSPAEVAKQAEAYLITMGQVAAPKTESSKTTAEANEPDWTHIG